MKKLLLLILICTTFTGCGFTDEIKSGIKKAKEEYSDVLSISKDVLSNFDSDTVKIVSNTIELYVKDGQLTEDEINKITLTLEDVIDKEALEKIIKKTKDSLNKEGF